MSGGKFIVSALAILVVILGVSLGVVLMRDEKVVIRTIQAPTTTVTTVDPNTPYTAEVFMLPTASEESIEAVNASLEEDLQSKTIAKLTHYDKDDAYKFFKEQYKSEVDLVGSVSPQDLPESFVVHFPNRSDRNVRDFVEKYDAFTEVDTVSWKDPVPKPELDKEKVIGK